MDRREYMRKLLHNKRPDVGANLRQKIESTKEAFALDRKARRDLRDMDRRNIDVNMSPYITPASKNIKLNVIKPSLKNDSVTKRLEMLAQWKNERTKAKQQQTHKPIFKVSKIVSDSSSNIQNANRFIKGKLIPALTHKSKFAPDNYAFKPPRAVINPMEAVDGKAGSKLGAAPKKKPVETMKSAKSNSTKAVNYKPESTITLRRSDRIRCKMEMVTNEQTAEGKPASGNKTKAPVKNSKKASRGKITKVVEEEEPAAVLEAEKKEWSVPVQGQNIPATAGSNKKLEKPDNATEVQTVLNTTFTLDTDDGAAGIIDDLSGIAALHISEVDYSTPPRKSSIITKSEGKKKETPYRKNIRTSTPVYAEEVLIDITFELQEKQNTPERRGSRKAKVAGDHAEVLDNVTFDLQERQQTPRRSNLFKVKGVEKTNKKPLSATKLPTINNDDIEIQPLLYSGSPFVTISRGKENAIKEYKIRRSLGQYPSMKNTGSDVPSIVNIHKSPVAAADYFMAKLNVTIQQINEMCEKWEACLHDPELPEEARASINVTIGQSKLLISKKFEQFRKLIVQCKKQDSAESCIKCDDLHGFWDMIYLQVEDLEKRYDNLRCLKENNWIELQPVKKVVKKSAKVRVNKPAATSRLKDLIKAAREKRNQAENNLVDDCKDVEVKTPKQEPQMPHSSSKRRSFRVSVLAENQRHTSPGLAMMKLSQSIRFGNGLTPTKSILKLETLKSTGKKSVTFAQSLTPGKLTPTALFSSRVEEKENTPRSVRRSRRTSQLTS